MKSSINKICLFLLAAISLTGCDEKRVYDHFVHTPNNGWEKTDFLSFPIPSISNDGEYELTLQLRTDHNFPFKSVVLISDSEVLPDGITTSDTLVCKLTDNQGNKLGPGINIYQYSFPLKKLNLHKDDSLNISIHHDMKREMLPGIVNVGIKLEKNK